MGDGQNRKKLRDLAVVEDPSSSDLLEARSDVPGLTGVIADRGGEGTVRRAMRGVFGVVSTKLRKELKVGDDE